MGAWRRRTLRLAPQVPGDPNPRAPARQPRGVTRRPHAYRLLRLATARCAPANQQHQPGTHRLPGWWTISGVLAFPVEDRPQKPREWDLPWSPDEMSRAVAGAEVPAGRCGSGPARRRPKGLRRSPGRGHGRTRGPRSARESPDRAAALPPPPATRAGRRRAPARTARARPAWALLGLVPDLDPLEAAARRSFLEHEAGQVLLANSTDGRGRPASHRLGVIRARRTEQPHVVLPPYQSHRLARHAESDSDPRAGRHDPDVPRQLLEEERVALVPAVVAHLLAQQAGRHADADLAHFHGYQLDGAPACGRADRPSSRRPGFVYPLRGWGNYFRTGNSAVKFNQLDTHVWRRLRGLLRKRYGRKLRPGQAERWTRTWFWGAGPTPPAGHDPLSGGRVAEPGRSSVSRVRENRMHRLKGGWGNRPACRALRP
jgi:hypothetical protein